MVPVPVLNSKPKPKASFVGSTEQAAAEMDDTVSNGLSQFEKTRLPMRLTTSDLEKILLR